MFNGVFSTVFNVDASVQAFAADLNSSDISSNDDFIQYPDETDNQTYQNAILHNKSIPLSFAIEEDETQQRVDSNSELVNTSMQSGTLAGGEQAETVVTSQGLLSEVFPEPEMDRPWFCSAYAAAGYFMCDPHTNIPKWCTYNLADIWCPDDPGYEYDPITGGAGGSSGGAGASRTWEENKCFDSSFKQIPCPEPMNDFLCQMNEYNYLVPLEEGDYFQLKQNETVITSKVPCDKYLVCYDINGIVIDCDTTSVRLAGTPDPGDFHTNDNTCGYVAKWSPFERRKPIPPCVKYLDYDSTLIPESEEELYYFDSSMRLQDPRLLVPLNGDGIENGYPLPVPEPEPGSDPFNPDYPETTEECASIICQCISFVVKALEKVDQSILQVVAAVQALSFEVPTPAPFDISPVTDRLDSILTAVDNISIEMVKEAETNMWDFLGETISTLNDLIQYLIDQIIYLIVPEDTDFLRENFSMLREAMSMKLEPVNMLKTQITASLMTEQKNFEDIEMDLPIYGRVEFLNVEFLNYAVPKIRALISGIMIIVTSVWAYRKITSDMVR